MNNLSDFSRTKQYTNLYKEFIDYKKQYILKKKCCKNCLLCIKINKENFNTCFITKIT